PGGDRHGRVSERRRPSGVTSLGDGGDQVVHTHYRGVVLDLDSSGGEVGFHRLDTLQPSDTLLDLGHAGRAGEAFRPHGGGGDVGGGAHHRSSQYLLPRFGRSTDFKVRTIAAEVLDGDQVAGTAPNYSYVVLHRVVPTWGNTPTSLSPGCGRSCG